MFFCANLVIILLKNVYFTTIFRCDQDVQDTLNVADYVIAQIKRDFPQLHSLYKKSDNAGCYAGNSVAELLYRICSKYDIDLKRYDYNEPQKGKDQADRESAVAKRYINAYVHSGNNCRSAEAIKQGIQYMGRPKDSKVSVIEIDKLKSNIDESRIKGIQSFHSVLYESEGMTFWHYFNCGEGKFIQYSDLQFQSGVNVIEPFDDARATTATSDHGKTRKDRILSTIVFCPEPQCMMTFNNQKELHVHINSNKHESSSSNTCMDIVKNHFADLVQQSSHNKTIISNCVQSTLKSSTSKLNLDAISNFISLGWALPSRSVKRFSYKQKLFLYEEFMLGENTGRKTTPEKVVEKMRKIRNKEGVKHFMPNEYLTAQQITSSFSRMSHQYRQGELKCPTTNRVYERELEINDLAVTDDVFVDEIDELIHNQLASLSDINNLIVGQFLWIGQRKVKKTTKQKHYAAQIISIDDGCVEVNYLNETDDYFWWPVCPAKSYVDVEDIHCVLTIPDIDRPERLYFTDCDLEKMKTYCSSS